MSSPEMAKAYYWAHRDEVLAKKAAIRVEDPDKFRLRALEWQRTHPERVKLHKRNTYSKRKGADGRYTSEDVDYLLSVQDHRCYYCEGEVGDMYEVDHFIPLARGGTNYADNIVIACRPCNRAKYSKMPADFMAAV